MAKDCLYDACKAEIEVLIGCDDCSGGGCTEHMGLASLDFRIPLGSGIIGVDPKPRPLPHLGLHATRPDSRLGSPGSLTFHKDDSNVPIAYHNSGIEPGFQIKTAQVVVFARDEDTSDGFYTIELYAPVDADPWINPEDEEVEPFTKYEVQADDDPNSDLVLTIKKFIGETEVAVWEYGYVENTPSEDWEWTLTTIEDSAVLQRQSVHWEKESSTTWKHTRRVELEGSELISLVVETHEERSYGRVLTERSEPADGDSEWNTTRYEYYYAGPAVGRLR